MKADEAVHALYVQATRKAEKPDIAKHLVALESTRVFPAVFVREAMKSAPIAWSEYEARWVETLKALSRTTRQYSVGDKAFIATAEYLSATPWLLEAVRAATVSDDAPLVALVALGRDASDESYDALLAEFERARTASSDWALRYKLKRLARYSAQSPHLAALDATVKQELERRDGAKVEGSLAQRLGLNVELLKFYLEVRGNRPKQMRDVFLIISGNDHHSGLPTQALGLNDLPPKDFMKVRDWLAKVTRSQKITWAWDEARVKTNLRGKYRDAMVEWLRGLRESPVP